MKKIGSEKRQRETGLNLEDVMPSEISATKVQILYDSPCVRYPELSNSTKSKWNAGCQELMVEEGE